MTESMDCQLQLLFFLCIFTVSAAQKDTIRVAVFEHARDERVISTNLDFYKRAAKEAQSKGAQLILFPEYGIIPSIYERDELKSILEFVPNPEKVRTNPCNERETYLERPILYALSCIAKLNDLIVVANMGDIQPCEGEPDCPPSGSYHLNTNVVFDRKGYLSFRYRKEYLFFELGMDLLKEKHNPVFKTDIGTFATFICFDIMFEKASVVARRQDIDAILFSTYWMNSFSMRTAVDFWQAFAVGNNATLLAANLQYPGHYTSGSGIFNGQYGSLAHTYNPDGISKLVVADIPRKSARSKNWKPGASSVTLITKNGNIPWKHDGKDIPKVCDYKKLPPVEDMKKEYRCFYESIDNYTLIKLTQPKGSVEACNNQMCCSLHYTTSGLKENFFLGVFNGTHNSFNRYSWVEENCFLSRCDALDGKHCDSISKSNTRFHSLHMSANFTTDFVYPSMMSQDSQLVPKSKWRYDRYSNKKSVHFESMHGLELLTASLKGRCFDRDPPYIR